MSRMAPLLFVLLSLACNRAPDPLAEQKKTCTDLSESKSLKANMTVDDCVRELKARDGREAEPAAAQASVAAPSRK